MAQTKAQAGDQLVLVGRILGPHGVRGLLRVQYFGDPVTLVGFGPVLDKHGKPLFEMDTKSSLKKGVMLMVANGVADRTAAEALKGTDLYISRQRLPEPEEDEFYNSDLIGLAAFHVDGTPMGKVKAVENFGASDLLEIQPPSGRSYYVPFTKEIVPEIDITGRKLTIDPPPGLIDDGSTKHKQDDGSDG